MPVSLSMGDLSWMAGQRAMGGRAIPVVLITGVPEAKLPADLGYDAYIGKPVDHEALGRVIERLTARDRA